MRVRTVPLLVVLELVALHILMVEVVFPRLGNSFFLYVPSRLGGSGNYIDPEGFILRSGIALGTTVLVAVAMEMVLRNGSQPDVVLILLVVLVGGTTVYMATFLGNVFDNFFQGWWSVLGVALACAIGFGLLLISARAFVERRGR